VGEPWVPPRLLEDSEARLDFVKRGQADQDGDQRQDGEHDPEARIRVARIRAVLDSRPSAGALTPVCLLDRGGIERRRTVFEPAEGARRLCHAWKFSLRR
jgi:hypothetical protein